MAERTNQPDKLITNICKYKHCGKFFVSEIPNQKYCSVRCEDDQSHEYRSQNILSSGHS